MGLDQLLSLFTVPFGWTDAIEVAILAFFLYRFFLLLQRTRAAQLVRGIVVLLVLWVFSFLLKLPTLTWTLEKIMTMFFIALPILFQPELRRGLEQLGRGEFLGTPWGQADTKTALVETLVHVTHQLAHRQIGAILVIEQRTGLGEYVRTGTIFDAQLSEEILLAVFNVLSPLHDGACILREGRVLAAGCYLPLSENPDLHRKYGTRHRAALGLSEISDAVVLVVSEERGEVNMCHQGVLIADLDQDQLRAALIEKLSTGKPGERSGGERS